MRNAIELENVGKTFTLHLQGGLALPVVRDVTFSVAAGECVVLTGPSGTGKSSILKMIFGSYRCDTGRILLRHDGGTSDVARAEPRRVLWLRRHVLGYVSQFLRAVPRVPALDVVSDALAADAAGRGAAREKARAMLAFLNIPERLFEVPPATFSGGEQQRVNIARGFLPDLPVLLLDEPTASLDDANRAAVVDLIAQKKARGTAIVAIAHDEPVRRAIADRVVDVAAFAA